MKKETLTQREKWLKKFGPENVYNTNCDHFLRINKEYSCKIKMDIVFCGNKCAYATNKSGTNRVDRNGKVIGVKNG